MNAPVFKQAIRSNVPLLIALIGGTGSGKTKSAMEIAKGLSGGKRFAVGDTETGRALHYADDYDFDHAEIRPPFRPGAYLEAILAADAANYPAIVIDSGSHVWAGEGGVLDWHEEELDRMAGTDWKKREACKMAAWIKPKVEHKKMVQRLLQVRTHVIMCFRAEQKVEMSKDERGKTVIVAKASPNGLDGWIPICDKALPYEFTMSFLLTADAPGILKPIKLQQQHRVFFPLDRPVNQDSGKRLGDWSRGGSGSSNTTPSAEQPDRALIEDIGNTKARQGSAALKAWWETVAPGAVKKSVGAECLPTWKATAESADRATGGAS